MLFSFDLDAGTYKKLLDFPREVQGGQPVGQLNEYEPACKLITYCSDKPLHFWLLNIYESF